MADRYDNEPERNRDWERERGRERGWGSQNRDWELGRSSDWDRGQEGRRYEGQGDWSRNMPRGGNPGAEGGEIGRGGFRGERGREYPANSSRYEGQRYY